MTNRKEKGCCASCCSSIFGLGLLVLIYWLVYQPHQIRVYVDTATLTNFSLSTTTSAPSLTYNLNLTLSFRNPNRRIGIYYDSLSSSLFYNGSQLGATETNFDPFFQHKKSTKNLNPTFAGRQDNLSELVREAFDKDGKEGAYNVEVKMRSKLREKIGIVKIRFKPKIDCWLRFLVTANGSASIAPFTKCDVDY